MKTFKLIFLSVLVLLSAAPLVAQQDAAIQSMMENRDREIKTVLGDQEIFTEAQRDQLKTLINDVIDFAAMGQHALGRHWADLSTEQKTDFTEVFATIVREQSLSDLAIYRAQVTYDAVTVEGEAATVATTTIHQGKRVNVAYALHQKDGAWRVTDIVLDDVSTAEGYARSFQSVVRKRGFDALMQSLYKRRDKILATS